MTSLVTAVIPSYNHSPYVETAIRSVLNQTMPDIEILVVDDGSSDNSVQRIQKLLAGIGDPRVEFQAQANRGLCRTLNDALLRARGHYFCYLGSDDSWEPYRLERQVTALEAAGPHVGAAFADCFVIDSAGTNLDRLGRQYRYRGGDIYLDLALMRFHPASPTNLFVREKLIKAGGFDEDAPVEDRDAWLRVARLYHVLFVDEPLGSFRVHGSNTSTNNPQKMHESNEKTFAQAFQVDPALSPLRLPIRARNQAGFAASFYLRGNQAAARREALRALRMWPIEPLAWRMLLRSAVLQTPLGARLQSWYRAWRGRG